MEEKNKRSCRTPSLGPGIFLQWGKKKRLRCLRAKDQQVSHEPNSVLHRRLASRLLDKERFLLHSDRYVRGPEAAILRSGVPRERVIVSSSEKDERCYPTRGSMDNNGKVCLDGNNGEDNNRKGRVWPKLFVTLSSREKEEDFMAMKGCKPPQRPKKRAKVIQRSLLLVSPGAWLSELCPDRYDVREKRSSKKRPRGLKAMGNLETDSE